MSLLLFYSYKAGKMVEMWISKPAKWDFKSQIANFWGCPKTT